MLTGALAATMPLGSGVYNPAVLSLSGWWRGSYSGSPWAGVASAGASGSRNLTEATTPPATGGAQNGHTPADFDGVDDLLSGAAFDAFITAGAGSIWCLARADAAAADGGVGSRINNPGLVFQDTGSSVFGLGFSDAGVTVAAYDGAYAEIVNATATGAYFLAQVKWDSTNLKMRVNSEAWDSVACGALSGLTSDILVVGKGFGAAQFDGRILEVGIASAALSDGTFDSVKSYVNARYALSL